MNFCLNRDTKLYHIRNPVSDSKDIPAEGYIECLNPNEFMAIVPKFSQDYSKLLYIGAKDRFISHTGNFQLRYLEWPQKTDSVLVVDKVASYPGPEDEFSGIWGYNQTLASTNFLGVQSRYAVFESPFKG